MDLGIFSWVVILPAVCADCCLGQGKKRVMASLWVVFLKLRCVNRADTTLGKRAGHGMRG